MHAMDINVAHWGASPTSPLFPADDNVDVYYELEMVNGKNGSRGKQLNLIKVSSEKYKLMDYSTK